MIHSFKQFDLHVSCGGNSLLITQSFLLTGMYQYLPTQSQVLATSAIFLAAKVEEQPRRLHYVGGVLYSFKHPGQPTPDPQSEVSRWWHIHKPVVHGWRECFFLAPQAFTRLIDDITYYEMMLLQTLGEWLCYMEVGLLCHICWGEEGGTVRM